MNNYNEQNAHPRDSFISFNEDEHLYTVRGREMVSVTTIISSYFEDFDADYWAVRKAPQLGMTPDEVKAMWERKSLDARLRGTEMHASIEGYYKGESIDDVPADIRPLFREFVTQYHLVPYRTEWAIYDEDSGIAGTLDFLELKDGVFTIYDWKRSQKLVKDGVPCRENHFRKTGFKPIAHVEDTIYWHYALQLSMYRYILEKNYGITAQGSRLAVFHPDNPVPYVIDVPYMKIEVQAIMNEKRLS